MACGYLERVEYNLVLNTKKGVDPESFISNQRQKCQLHSAQVQGAFHSGSAVWACATE